MARFLALCVGLFVAASAAAADKITKPVPADQQLPHFVVPKGFEVELVAAEPLVINPITMTLDDQGRIYVSESHTYRYGPSGSPIKPFSNPIVRLDPDGKGYKRVLVAEGFEEPVMGLAIRGGKLWATANNFLYQFDLGDDGKATNKKTILVDKNKAWNPFGMFVVEFGIDGLLYLSVGNHNIDIGGPTNRVSGRGGSGIVCRMKPDGSNLERLVHGLRVPYSFEYDPFGQLWLLSNGEGNPNRFVKVIDGVDYHCYSRGVDNNWLAGKHVLAPPCLELPSGANTQLIRYYGAGFPADYQGSLLLDNWGAHGFNGANRAVLRYVPDERGNITTKETFVGCTDPHFRPSHIVVDPNGDLLVADWYGRDDESDLTGRIWRVKYTGADKPQVTHKVDGSDLDREENALAALGSPHHLIREKATAKLLARGNDVVDKLNAHIANTRNPLGAAHGLWVLFRMGTPEAYAAIPVGGHNPDWRVRRLAMNIVRRHKLPHAAELAAELLKNDKDPAVRLEAALALSDAKAQRTALVKVLQQGAAADAHLRYEAACHMARVADAETIDQLLDSADADVRLAGLIAIDVACYENLPGKQGALDVLAFALEHSSKADTDLLLTLAQLNGEKGVVAALEKLVVRNDVPPAVTGRALLVLRAKAGSVSQGVLASAGKRFLEAVEKGTVKLSSSSDQLLLLELLESEGPTPFAVKQVGGLLNGQPPVRAAAHDLARKFGPKAAALSDALWPRALDAKGKPEDRLDWVATLARVEEAKPAMANWEKLLGDAAPAVRAETVRGWRTFKDPDMRAALVARAPDLLKDNAVPADDLAVVLRQLGVDPDALKKLDLPAADPDKDRLTAQAVEQLGKLPAPERPVRAALGRLVFERTGCTKCHTTVTQNTVLAPSLKGIATAQKIDYLIESVLYPSKVIKTGFESELVVTKAGKPLTGLVKEEGDFLRILNADGETKVAKKDVDERAVQKVSVMPDGQEKLISRQEFIDLIAYLQSLK